MASWQSRAKLGCQMASDIGKCVLLFAIERWNNASDAQWNVPAQRVMERHGLRGGFVERLSRIRGWMGTCYASVIVDRSGTLAGGWHV